MVSKDRVSVDPSKVETVMGWKQPTTLTKIRSFLGLTGYYRRLLTGFQYCNALDKVDKKGCVIYLE